MGDGDYFGYTPGGNERLRRNNFIARHMGEDMSHYPPVESGGEYPGDTINWDDPKLSGQQKENENSLLANDSIEKIRKRMLAQDPTAMYGLADKWFRVIQVIEDIRERVRNAALGLKNGGDGTPGNNGGWRGQGANAFLARGPGATLKSLEDWHDAAYSNWMGTLTLAQAIPTHQGKINELYEQYKQAMVSYSKDWLKHYGLEDKKVEDLSGEMKDQYVTDLKNLESWWSIQARQIQFGMAKEYHSVMNGELRGGSSTVYEGPTDAVMPDPNFLAKIIAPTVPNVGKPNVGKPNVGKPNVGKPNVDKPNIDKPDLKDRPNIDKPSVDPDSVPDPRADVDAPTRNIVNPPVPTVVPPMPPPVVPPLPVGQKPPTGLLGPRGAPTLDPALRNNANNLLNNLPGQGKGVQGLLNKQAFNAGQQLQNTNPPSLPQSPMKGQPGAPPPQAPLKGKPTTGQQGRDRGQIQRPGSSENEPQSGRGTPGAPPASRQQRAPG
ncbi:hypothetical protein ACFQ0D_08010, partial [Micromonospora zhanjiangensis]